MEDLLFEFTGSWYCWLDYDSGQISLFRGSPSGYEATAAWTLRTDAPIGDAVAVQNDDDPELELLLQDGDPSTLSYCPPPERGLYLVDGVTDAPNVSLLWSFVAATAFEALEPFDDLDGDGRADVVFYAMVYSAASGTDEHTLARSLLSTRGWSPSDPGFTIPLYTDKVGFLGGTDIEGRAVADIDLDGRLDIVTALMVDYPHNIAYAYVWYPSREPAPLDTGAPDTGGTAETGATVETGGPVDSGGPTASPPPEDACGGCATGAPWSAWVLVPWVAAMRRRGGAQC